ncbi:hypothetical protein NKR23_g10893 [Pleurostoma richardsiae]|uniref:Uncharacterized protein n=1 Tax=Pleurostoma richardsiae TaxID=41990 RepID=A0AA38R947_9PEZI|nr:hypothetical protein NKR23_g10893 [Pleurostoma richardsiae]
MKKVGGEHELAIDSNHCWAMDPQSAGVLQCRRRELYKCAYGFLLPYTALIQHESDLRIAVAQDILPDIVTWQIWGALVNALLEDSPSNLARVNKRYRFGELRLGRINKIVRVRALGHCSGLKDLLRWYKYEFATYGQQLPGADARGHGLHSAGFDGDTSWVGNPYTGESDAFKRASWCFPSWRSLTQWPAFCSWL